MSEQIDRTKIIDKIQKCLRLSKSSNPHEAAAAFRQAQKLMAVYSISDEEIVGREVHHMLVISRAPFYKKLPLNFTYMLGIVTAAFGVECVVEPALVKDQFRLAFRYFGPKPQVEMALYAHQVIDRALWSSWNAYRKDKPWLADQRGARMGFWVGWLQEVRSTIINFYGAKKDAQEEMRAAGNTDIVPLNEEEQQRAKAKKAMAVHYNESLSETKVNSMELHAGTHGAGRKAAKDFQLHRPINGERQRQIGN